MENTVVNWIDDYFNSYEIHKFAFKEIVFQTQSKYQKIIIVDTYNYGRCLILDNEFQSAESDEFIYHEALVHPSLILHPGAENVLIIGGGEGATLREVLRYRTIRQAILVDIDKEVIESSKNYLPTFHVGSFDDKRAKVIIDDGRNYVEQTKEHFDVIIIDLNDPMEGTPSYMLFTKEFYQIIAKKLKINGILIIQSGSVSIIENYLFTRVFHTLNTVFQHVFPYTTFVPSYSLQWGFTLATQNLSNLDINDEEIEDRIKTRLPQPLRFYDSLTHHHMFNIPKYLREDLKRNDMIIQDNDPLIKTPPHASANQS